MKSNYFPKQEKGKNMIISKSNKKQKVNNSKNNVYKRMTKQTKILIHQ